MKKFDKLILALACMIIALTFNKTMAGQSEISYPETPKIPVEEVLHGTTVVDDYRWLEDGDDPKVIEWVQAQEKISRSIIDDLPQRSFLVDRFNELWRYDYEEVPDKVIDGQRIFFWAKKKDDEKWIYKTKKNEQAEAVVLIDPNQWEIAETLHGVAPSRDGKYVAFGKAIGGDENPVVQVMEVETGKILPDKLKGWKQNVSSWLPDNAGFFYSAKPLKGEVPADEEDYWHAAYYHKLGSPVEEDKKVFSHQEIKEYWHSADVSEDGKYVIFYRGLFNTNEIYFRKAAPDEQLIPIATGFDARYSVDFIEDKILIKTDSDAPLNQVFITDIAKPERENWRVFIPEHEQDKLSYIAGVDGHIYAVYQHNAYTQIKIYNLAGEYLRDLSLPTLGDADISGYWSKDEVWVWFSSFTYPSTTFKYDFAANNLELYKKFPVEIDVDDFTTEQVWYNSKDGTPVSMFLVRRKDLQKTGNNPVLLTGYGGFNVSETPHFSTSYVVWLEAGGMVATPNLRGGGEYGREWHEAGMLDKKQNVFDDFIAAAEWLIENKYTNPEKLAIRGGSNGGLLVGAVTVQRPELFNTVHCAVPLLDMIRFHKFDFSNVWAEEYGNADDPEQFKYLYKYSPYHNVVDGADYPTMLFTGSVRDARTNPLHARKMAARMQAANPGGKPILLLQRESSGHHGGTTLTIKIEQNADIWSFLMDQLGMQGPEN